jgi:hypothetical protein
MLRFLTALLLTLTSLGVPFSTASSDAATTGVATFLVTASIEPFTSLASPPFLFAFSDLLYHQ